MPGNEPLVTIVIPFYNDRYVTEAVDSALAQTYPALEIIIVDDGSTKHSELLAPYAGRIHYLGKANGGTASALNHGFRAAGGKYIAWLSSDDRFYPEKIARQAEAMERQGSWISHTGFDLIDDAGQLMEAGIVPPATDMAQFYRTFAVGNPVNGCTVMMRGDLYRHIGAFDERLPFTHDLDYWYRVMLAGFPFLLLPEALTAYRRHDQMGTMRHQSAIARELQETQRRYASRWRYYLNGLGFDGESRTRRGKS